MGWSWAAVCSVLGRGHIEQLPAQLVGFTVRLRVGVRFRARAGV